MKREKTLFSEIVKETFGNKKYKKKPILVETKIMDSIIFDVPFFINEGLIETYDIEKVVTTLADIYNLELGLCYLGDFLTNKTKYDGLIDKTTVPTTKEDVIVIILPNNEYLYVNKEQIDKKMNKYGWFYSASKTLTFKGKPYNDWIILQYEEKYGTDVTEYIFNNKSIKFLYHLTSNKNIKKILKNGIVPKYTERNDFKNPDRIYFFIKEIDNYTTSIISNSFNNSRNDKQQTNEYCLLEIDKTKLDKNIKLYIDPRMKNAVYTFDNVSPSAITIKNKFKIQ